MVLLSADIVSAQMPSDTAAINVWRNEWFAYERELRAWCTKNAPATLDTCMQQEMTKHGVSPAFFATLRAGRLPSSPSPSSMEGRNPTAGAQTAPAAANDASPTYPIYESTERWGAWIAFHTCSGVTFSYALSKPPGTDGVQHVRYRVHNNNRFRVRVVFKPSAVSVEGQSKVGSHFASDFNPRTWDDRSGLNWQWVPFKEWELRQRTYATVSQLGIRDVAMHNVERLVPNAYSQGEQLPCDSITVNVGAKVDRRVDVTQWNEEISFIIDSSAALVPQVDERESHSVKFTLSGTTIGYRDVRKTAYIGQESTTSMTAIEEGTIDLATITDVRAIQFDGFPDRRKVKPACWAVEIRVSPNYPTRVLGKYISQTGQSGWETESTSSFRVFYRDQAKAQRVKEDIMALKRS